MKKNKQEQDARIAREVAPPTIRTRVTTARRLMVLAAAATQKTDEALDQGEAIDIYDAVNRAARDASEELFWLLEHLPATILDTMAPDSDQLRDIDQIRGGAERPELAGAR